MHRRTGGPLLPGGVTEFLVDDEPEEPDVEELDEAEDADEEVEEDEVDEADECEVEIADEVEELGDMLQGGCVCGPICSLLSGDFASTTLARSSPLPVGRFKLCTWSLEAALAPFAAW